VSVRQTTLMAHICRNQRPSSAAGPATLDGPSTEYGSNYEQFCTASRCSQMYVSSRKAGYARALNAPRLPRSPLARLQQRWRIVPAWNLEYAHVW
jgi:hypothetical protein